MELTKKSLLKLCREMNLYSTPELNDKLYLHQKGICKIQNLDEYTGVRVLWLQSNAIEIIENLNHLTELRHLYLNENLIRRIDGEQLCQLQQLDTLNLERNYITKIEKDDLSKLIRLNTLNIAHNRLSGDHSLCGLLHCPSLTVLDLRNNNITVTHALIDNILSKMQSLKVLYLMTMESNDKSNQNTICNELSNYRKTVIAKCKLLRHLDDRPIFEDERRCCDAWLSGGIEAEREERLKIRNEKNAKQQANHDAFTRLVQEARNRRQKQAQIQDDDDDEIDEDDDESQETGELHLERLLTSQHNDDDLKSESDHL